MSMRMEPLHVSDLMQEENATLTRQLAAANESLECKEAVLLDAEIRIQQLEAANSAEASASAAIDRETAAKAGAAAEQQAQELTGQITAMEAEVTPAKFALCFQIK